MTKEYVIKDLFGILVILNVNVITHVMLENIKIMKILNVEKISWQVGEECSENIGGNEIIYNKTVNNDRKVCNSCTIFLVLFIMFFIISIVISSTYFCYHWY